jgi:hypothetical protein
MGLQADMQCLGELDLFIKNANAKSCCSTYYSLFFFECYVQGCLRWVAMFIPLLAEQPFCHPVVFSPVG